MSQVILVNEQDEAIGQMDKMQAHEEALMHRAFSVFIFNEKGEMLLQQRALQKYHSGGLWTNACCSHPQPGEETMAAALRRLKEELGFDTALNHAFTFTYKSAFDNGLTEHEVDHVFTGIYSGHIQPDASEVKAYRYQSIESIRQSLANEPHLYTAWFQIAFPRLEEHLAKNNFIYATHRSPAAAVIGAGVAGMAVAIRLAQKGFEVDVYERNATAGGKLTAFEKDGYRFDAGPSLFTQPVLLEELFALAGESLSNYLQYEEVPVSCKYFFENGKVITAYHDKEKFATEIETVAGEPSKNLYQYLAASKKLYNHIGAIFLNEPLNKWSTWLSKKLWHALPAVKYAYLFHSLNTYNTKHFKSPELQQVFNRFATYNGSNPFKVPAMLSLIPHLEMNEGVFYPRGGMVSIANALQKLAEKKGVRFHFNSAVEHIIHTEGTAKGVVVNNKNHYADAVVSNADIYFTWQKLMGRADKAAGIAKQERSSSALVFYWGIGAEFSQLGLHNIFFSKNYKEEFDCIFSKKSIYKDPTVYINITSKQEGGHAPAGKENWFVMVNVPAHDGNWEQIQLQVKRQVIDKLSRLLQTDIESLIESETILNPTLIELQTGSFMGALYGGSSNTKMAAFKRPANSGSIRQLYHSGGTVHPGGGIPLCLKSAQITAELIFADQKKHTQH